jgi:hypothetical protein
VFALFKIVATFVLACLSVIAAVLESRHPTLFACLVAAFVGGAFASEVVRTYRNRTVRSSVK